MPAYSTKRLPTSNYIYQYVTEVCLPDSVQVFARRGTGREAPGPRRDGGPSWDHLLLYPDQRDTLTDERRR